MVQNYKLHFNINDAVFLVCETECTHNRDVDVTNLDE